MVTTKTVTNKLTARNDKEDATTDDINRPPSLNVHVDIKGDSDASEVANHPPWKGEQLEKFVDENPLEEDDQEGQYED
uniref:Uncharacterized protein n=1 Tax=Cannabis sativa TaxID=3483 RepID=A0A803PDL9_CANSA